MDNDLAQFISNIPKAELHLHLEGSLEPEQMFELAQRNGVDIPFTSVDEIKAAYKFNNLQEFLDIYYAGMRVLQTERDFYELTWAYLERCQRDRVRHVEIFFDPQAHTGRQIPFGVPITGINQALRDSEARFGISHKLIMCFLRHLSEDDAFDTLQQAQAYLDLIDGVGLDSSEVGHPPSKFSGIFAAAKSQGLHCVAHAGEEGPPQYVWEALNCLQVERIDHGNRAMEDLDLVAEIRNRALALTVCPLSNLKLCVVDDLSRHPLKTMLSAGLLATVNSDDPAYFGGYINENYLQTAAALNLSRADIVTLAKNSFIGSFLSDDKKAAFIGSINDYNKCQ